MVTHISFVHEKDLLREQAAEIARLSAMCFRDVSRQESEENFIAQPFARLIALDGETIIGTLQLFERNSTFLDRSFKLGGIGGVCVAQKYRRRGIARQMTKQALEILSNHDCDVACLNTQPDTHAFTLYESLGFHLMQREASFENSKGQIIYDYGTMFVPIGSKSIYELLMTSHETFHYGRGYW